MPISEKVRFRCKYGAKEYVVSVDLGKSQYFRKLTYARSFSFLPYYSTIDDKVVIDIANQLNGQLEGRRPFVKASVVLALIQQNIEYVTDEKRFGKDVWEIPIYVLRERVADCDGMANLYVSIAHNMGLDVICVCITGHMCAAINVPGCHGKKYEFEGKTYYHVESTDDLPAPGRYWNNSKEELFLAAPEIPTEDFKDTLKKY